MVYARSVSDVADDNDAARSVCFPVSAIRGFIFSTSGNIILRYESPYQFAMEDNGNCDGLILSLTVSGTHKTFIENFAREIAFGDSYFITLCDNVTSEAFTGINGVGITSDTGAD
tara:strand:+ start:22499 stop:22843 length:345 start_codon:yes stop_codon:yes gene_type:complete